MWHWYCKKLLKGMLSQAGAHPRYKVKRIRGKPGQWQFTCGTYQQTVFACCCRHSAAYVGLAGWLERGKADQIKVYISEFVRYGVELYADQNK
jgi:hypothetical protein